MSDEDAGGPEIRLNRHVMLTCRAWVLALGAVAALSWSCGAFVFTRWQRADDWVHEVNAAMQRLKKISAAHRKLELDAEEQSKNTAMHCRLGHLSREWCEDQGHKVPKNAPAGAGGG